MPGDRFVGRRYLQLVLVLGALVAIGALTIDTYLPALPTLTQDLSATDTQAQLTITGLLAGLGVGQLIVGPLSDAFGRRKPLLIGLVAHGLMSVLCAFAPTIELLTAVSGAARSGRCRRVGGGDGDGPRPVQRRPRGQAVVPADPGDGDLADSGAVAGQCVAEAHLVARHLRLPRGRGGAADRARCRRAAGDTAAGPPGTGPDQEFAGRLRPPVPGSDLPDYGRGGRSDVLGSVRLHRRLVLRPAGILPVVAAAVRVGLQRHRRRADHRHPAQSRS